MEIGELKVRRAPEYDDAKLIEGRCYGEDYASSILSENGRALSGGPPEGDTSRPVRGSLPAEAGTDGE